MISYASLALYVMFGYDPTWTLYILFVCVHLS